MANVTKGLAIDKNAREIQLGPPDVVGLVSRTTENASTSSVITMADGTTLIEVAASVTPAVIKWIATGNTNPSVISAAGTANFDVIIPIDGVRKLAVPHETQGIASNVGIGVQAGLYRRYAWKSTGVGSIMSVEY